MSSPVPNRESKQPSTARILAKDLAPVAALGILLICIHELANPIKRGFFCNDETIRYPHRESTVSSRLCYFGGSSLVLVLIALLEWLHVRRDANNPVTGSNQLERQPNQTSFKLTVYLKRCYSRSLVWLFGGISSELLTDIFKICAGRLRPHFIAICQPVIHDNDSNIPLDKYCQDSNNAFRYITSYECTGKPSMQRDIRLSFLSGHSSYSAYSAAFAVVALDGVKSGFIKPTLQVLIISTAFYVGLSRISDYKHHWQDVLAGLSLGTTIAALVHAYVWPAVAASQNKYIRTKSGPDSESGDAELSRMNY